MAHCCVSRDVHFMLALPRLSKTSSQTLLRARPRCWRATSPRLANREGCGLWGKAGQRSLERSALLEAVEQLRGRSTSS